MLETKVEIVNKLGLHARAAAKFVTLASTFNCEVFLQKEQQRVNGKSIMGVMMLAAAKGSELLLATSGDDEQQATELLIELINNRFGEDE